MRIISRNAVDHLVYRLCTGNTSEVADIAVNSNRRTGVGREMVDQMISEVKLIGVKRVFAITRDTNAVARQFYEALGFTGTLVPNFYEDSSGYIYVKEI